MIAAIAAYVIMRGSGQAPFSSSLTFPFIKDFLLNLGWFFIPFGCFVIVGAGNAVNLTDGLDGLAIVPVMIAAAVLRRHRLSRRATRSSPTICRSISCRAPANWPSCSAR